MESPDHLDEESLALLKASKSSGSSQILPPTTNLEYLSLEISPGKHEAGKADNESSTSGTSDLGSAVFNLATSIIGAGIMALPATMRVLGLPLGIFSIFAMGVLSEISLEMVVYFATKLRAWSYGDMVEGACGWVCRLVSQLCIIVNNSGILVVYLIIIGDVISGSSQHHGLLQQWSGSTSTWTDRRLVVFLTMVFVLAPLCSLRRIDSLRYSSALSVALALVFVVLASGIALVKGFEGKLVKPRMFPSFSSTKAVLELLTVVPIMTNAFICHFNIQPIYLELKERTPAKMNNVGRISTLLCISVYVATALSGYLLFGEKTASDVLSNFDANLGIHYSDILDNVIRVGYVLHLMLVFPVINFSLRQNVDALMFPKSTPLVTSKWRYWLLTLTLLVVVFLGSTFIPNIWIAFQFTGATSGLALGFIFPAVVTLRLVPSDYMGIKYVAWTMLVLASVSSFLGLTTNIYNVATHHVD